MWEKFPHFLFYNSGTQKGGNMITTCVLTGWLDDMKNEYLRYLKTRDIFVYSNKEVYSYIPVMYWNRKPNNPLFRKENGHYVIIQGHLECHEKYGLYVVAEKVQYAQLVPPLEEADNFT